MTKAQETMLDTFLADLDSATAPAYRAIAERLTALGYSPRRERGNLSFKCEAHNKQMAKMGIRRGKAPGPFFALRFSACRGYSRRFEDVVQSNIERYPSKTPGCAVGACVFCAGAPETHVYIHEYPDGTRGMHCGAYALEIPDVAPEDVQEIGRLIEEEHAFLMAHEA